jgi:hypothetical protein
LTSLSLCICFKLMFFFNLIAYICLKLLIFVHALYFWPIMSVHALTAWVFEILMLSQVYLYSSYIDTKVHKSQAIEIKYKNTEAVFLVVCDPSVNEL